MEVIEVPESWRLLARSPSSHVENPAHPRDSSAGRSDLIYTNRQQNLSGKTF